MVELPATVADARAPYRYLGVFRFGLALLVTIQTTQALLPAWVEAAVRPLEPGRQAAVLFFMLSGFVIAEAAAAFYAARPGAFLGNRLLRTMPSYVAAALVSAILLSSALKDHITDTSGGSMAPDGFAPATLLWNLLAPFPMPAPIGAPIRGHEWLAQVGTLRVVFAFYVAFAAVLLLASMVRLSLAAVQTGAATLLLLLLATFPGGLAGTMVEAAPFFIFGTAYFHLVTQEEDQWFPASFCLAALAFMVAHLLGQAPPSGRGDYGHDRTGELIVVMILSAAFLVLARIDRGADRDVLSRFDRAMGDLAYPLCLFQGCVTIAARAWLPNHSWSSTGLAFGLAVAIAILAVLVIERPVARLRGRLRRVPRPRLQDRGLRKGSALS